MNRQAAMDLLSRYTSGLWNERDYTIVDSVLSAEFVDHDPLPGQEGGRSGYIDMVRSMHSLFPGLQIQNEDICFDAETSTLVVRWSAKDTNTGGMLGLVSKRRLRQMQGIEMFRVDDGLLTERWGEVDAFSLFSQKKSA